MSSSTSTVDINIPRFNQAVVAALTALAFVVQSPLLVTVTFLVLVVSWVGGPRIAPLTQLYVRLVRPRLDPDGPREFEPAAPPRFAQQVGSLFLGTGSVLLAAGQPAAGWSRVRVVTALSTLAAATRICVGCILYRRVAAR